MKQVVKFDDYRGKKLTETVALERINILCSVKNYVFLGFVDKNNLTVKFSGNTTRLKIQCTNCGVIFNIMFSNFVKCCECKNCLKKQKENERVKYILDIIQQRCEQEKLIFHGFCDKKHKPIEYRGAHKTYLSMECMKCKNQWFPSCHDFLGGHKCFSCSIKATSEKRKKDLNVVLDNIISLCNSLNYDFLGFCDENGEFCEYKNNRTRLVLKCKNCGYQWNTTRYYTFINGVKCKNCNKIRKSSMEEQMSIKLAEANVDFIRNDRKILYGLELDFYIPSKNIAIECQGIQHFRPINKSEFALKLFEEQIQRDKIKREICKIRKIKLLYYSDVKTKYPYKIYNNIEDIIEIIKQHEASS